MAGTYTPKFISGLESSLSRRGTQLILLCLVGALYVGAYLTHPLRPGNKTEHPEGWWSWWDQSQYLKESVAFAQLHVTPDAYRFPPGYSLMGALFWHWMPDHPFFLPDLILTLGTAWIWWRLACRLMPRVASAAVGFLFLAAHAPLLNRTAVIPFNTIPSEFTLLFGILVLISNQSERSVIWLSTLTACTYLIRPADAVCFAPMLIYSVVRIPKWPRRIRSALIGIGITTVPILILPCINYSVFGFWASPYEQQSWREIGFLSYPISYKAFWILVDGTPFFGETKPGLLFRYPWLVLAIPGSLWWVKKEGCAGVAALLSVAVNWFVYLNYNDFLPSDIYRFSLIHYIAGTFPFLFLIACGTLVSNWNTRWGYIGCGVALVALAFACGIQMTERQIQTVKLQDPTITLPSQRPLWVRITDLPPSPSVKLKADGKPLKEYHDYLVPYVGPEFQFLLSTKVAGDSVSVEGVPAALHRAEIGEFEWTWGPTKTRLESFFQ